MLGKDGKRILVQCKNWRSSKVGVSTVRELFGVVTAEGASEGIVVCSGKYTNDALDFAKGKPITLVDGAALARLFDDVQKLPQIQTTVKDTA
jgi:restriction system protein